MNSTRTLPIDLLRGLIIVFMALDHASGMIARVHFQEFWGISFEAYPNIAWWFTRFISHFCAPGFFFLMGMSMALFAHNRLQSNWSTAKIRTYFMKRAGIILACMFLLEFPAWGLGGAFNQNHETAILPGSGFSMETLLFPSTVLFGLAAAMFVGSILWLFQKWQLLLVTISCFAFSAWVTTQALATPTEAFSAWSHLLYLPGASNGVVVIYPLIPWLGITTFGMFWGKLLLERPTKIYALSLQVGLILITAFFALRFLELGNFNKNTYDNFISFFTLIKYPPSLVFATWTCGINLLLFFLFSKIGTQKWLHPILVFGQTAMFFYLLHLYIYALLGAFFPLGSSIEIMYLLWLLGLVLLYFACRAFLKFKHKKPSNSLWRML